jgi:hypothetical protein
MLPCPAERLRLLSAPDGGEVGEFCGFPSGRAATAVAAAVAIGAGVGGAAAVVFALGVGLALEFPLSALSGAAFAGAVCGGCDDVVLSEICPAEFAAFTAFESANTSLFWVGFGVELISIPPGEFARRAGIGEFFAIWISLAGSLADALDTGSERFSTDDAPASITSEIFTVAKVGDVEDEAEAVFAADADCWGLFCAASESDDGVSLAGSLKTSTASGVSFASLLLQSFCVSSLAGATSVETEN